MWKPSKARILSHSTARSLSPNKEWQKLFPLAFLPSPLFVWSVLARLLFRGERRPFPYTFCRTIVCFMACVGGEITAQRLTLALLVLEYDDDCFMTWISTASYLPVLRQLPLCQFCLNIINVLKKDKDFVEINNWFIPPSSKAQPALLKVVKQDLLTC